MENNQNEWPTINWDDTPTTENINVFSREESNKALDKFQKNKSQQDSLLTPKETYFDQAHKLHKETLGAIETTNSLLKELIAIVKG